MHNHIRVKMIKTISLLSLLTMTYSVLFAQNSCQSKKSLFDKHSAYKSGFDNLRSDTVDVLNYNIYLDFTQVASQQISGNCKIRFQTLENINTLSLDLLQLNIDSVKMHNSLVSYTYNDTLLIIELPSQILSGNQDSLTVYYNGSPQQDPSGWGGFYFTGAYAFNLGVGFASDPHNYGRVWHPCFDNFAEKATYDFAILTNNGKTAYCNGERVSVQTVGLDSLLTTWHMPDAINTYLASVAVAPYTHVEQNFQSNLTGHNIPIWLIAEPGDTNNMKASFINIDGAIDGFEHAYGPHQFNKVGFVLVPFSSGAMEHATNIAYPQITANGSLTYETLMAHELAHHWWGDYVTCATEEEMWINEGMASYSERIFLEHVYNYDRYIAEVRDNHHAVLHTAHLNDNGYYALDAVPHAYTYGDHSYNKGSDVAHTLRGYMGDSLFFAGLQSTLNAFGGGNLSSLDFMNHLNTLNGVDVTDFFNDWIMSPGFSHFSIVSYEVSGSGPYTVDVVVDQKLKARSDFHNNVPLQIRFMDEDWNVHNEEIMMSGDYQLYSFQVPFMPVLVDINMNERINDATTGVSEVVTSTGLNNMPYANARITVNSITDSAFVRIVHNWIYPSYNEGVPAGITISPQRYWHVLGIDTDNMDATMRFEYNGQLNNAGYYDEDLLIDYGLETFIEDSIVLLYRPNGTSPWVEHPDYTIAVQGSNTDKKGIANTGSFMAGQYTWGYKTNSLGINKPVEAEILLYPNPSDGVFQLKINRALNQPTALVYDANGKLVQESKIISNQIELNHLPNGNYTVTILENNTQIHTQQLSLIK